MIFTAMLVLLAGPVQAACNSWGANCDENGSAGNYGNNNGSRPSSNNSGPYGSPGSSPLDNKPAWEFDRRSGPGDSLFSNPNKRQRRDSTGRSLLSR